MDLCGFGVVVGVMLSGEMMRPIPVLCTSASTCALPFHEYADSIEHATPLSSVNVLQKEKFQSTLWGLIDFKLICIRKQDIINLSID